MDCVSSLLYTAKLEKQFWAEAFSTAAYIRNRGTSRSPPRIITPYHLSMGKSPDLSYFRAFEAKCWFILPKTKVRKLDARSRR